MIEEIFKYVAVGKGYEFMHNNYYAGEKYGWLSMNKEKKDDLRS